VSYNAVLDVGTPSRRTALAVGGLLVSVGMLGFWLYRLYRWRRPARPGAAEPAFGSRLDAERPRSDALVAAVLWRHGTLRPALWFVVYAIFVMPVPALFVADYRYGTDAVLLAPFAPFALGLALTAPVSGLPFFWWVRRRRGEIRRVVRHGEIIPGAVVWATVWGTPGIAGLLRFRASHATVDVAVSLGGGPRYYRFEVQGPPEWGARGVAVRVLASSEERFAIVIAPTGQDYAAWAVRTSARGGKVAKLAAARVVKVPSRGELKAVAGAVVAAETDVTTISSGDSAPRR
jgi:hypothetical protein